MKRLLAILGIVLMIASSADACCLFGIGSRVRARIQTRRAVRVYSVPRPVSIVRAVPVVRRFSSAPVYRPARPAPAAGSNCPGGACVIR